MIELKELHAGYGGTRVLTGLSAGFERACLTGIIGVNGCGKSTLLKAVLGILPLSAGTVLIDGVPINSMTRREIALRLAYLAQSRGVPDMTVEQLVLHGRFPHLSYPRRYAARDRDAALCAMRQTGIEQLAGSPLASLSGGMRQNAYISMALAQGADYLLLDEPSTHLDIAHQLSLMRMLRSLAEDGRGVAAVMHDLPMAMTFSDRILLLHDGRAAFFGTPEQLRLHGAVKNIFGVDIERTSGNGHYTYRY